jgi:hypothetical protein
MWTFFIVTMGISIVTVGIFIVTVGIFNPNCGKNPSTKSQFFDGKKKKSDRGKKSMIVGKNN